MSVTIIVGLQWGDEGKGKIVDAIANNFDYVVRFQGGNNAGHTVVNKTTKYKFNLLPSGILQENTISVIGGGVVVNPFHLCNEIDLLKKQGVNISPQNLILSETAALILPFHKTLDDIYEEIKSKNKIGTTKRGIGPAYADSVLRFAIRICDLKNDDLLREKLYDLSMLYNPILEQYHKEKIDIIEIIEQLNEIKNTILQYSQPIWKILYEAQESGKSILLEGAQGAMLDKDYGTYPFVTSSNTLPVQAFLGSGLPYSKDVSSVGIIKAYTTRVGEGPFPTEIENNSVSDHLGNVGKEIGTVTQRIRRCGWLDLVLLKHMVKISAISKIIITKLDVLTGLKEINLCIGYKYKEQIYDYFPAETDIQNNLTPIYKAYKGWNQDITKVTNYNDLPIEAQEYLSSIGTHLKAKIIALSVGESREQIVDIALC